MQVNKNEMKQIQQCAPHIFIYTTPSRIILQSHGLLGVVHAVLATRLAGLGYALFHHTLYFTLTRIHFERAPGAVQLADVQQMAGVVHRVRRPRVIVAHQQKVEDDEDHLKNRQKHWQHHFFHLRPIHITRNKILKALRRWSKVFIAQSLGVVSYHTILVCIYIKVEVKTANVLTAT